MADTSADRTDIDIDLHEVVCPALAPSDPSKDNEQFRCPALISSDRSKDNEQLMSSPSQNDKLLCSSEDIKLSALSQNSQTQSQITILKKSYDTQDAQEISLSCLDRDSVKFETSDQDHGAVCVEENIAADFVVMNTSINEWNILNVEEKANGSAYSVSDNVDRSDSHNNIVAPSTIDIEAGTLIADVICDKRESKKTKREEKIEKRKERKREEQEKRLAKITADSPLAVKTCFVENDFKLELFNFPLNKKVHETEFMNANECNKRANSRKRRNNAGRTKCSRKWKANSLCEEVIGNFDFSMFPYRAECMTTDADELAYMDEQLAILEASVTSGGDETSVTRAQKSSSNVLTSPKSLVQIVTEKIDKTNTQSNPEAKCLASDSSRTPTGDKSKNSDDLGRGHKLKIGREPSMYFSDVRYDMRNTYEDGLYPRHVSRSMTVDGLFDLQDRGAVVRLRRKKKWRIEKAHVQVKTKYCQSIHNAAHGRTFYAHHRVTKLMPMCLEKLPYFAAAQLSTRRMDKAKGTSIEALKENVKIWRTYRTPVEKAKPVVRPPQIAPVPRYAINRNNADAELSADLINILIGMQDRDLSPEDYELLLRLDERVAPKTIDVSQLNLLKTDIVGEERVDLENCMNKDVCTVCMDMYEVGQVRKYLPCGHGFHADCIDGWLTNASINCPLDGQEVRL